MSTLTDTSLANYYYVVHPLDDEPEEKCSTEGLGRMQMSRAAKISLGALRLYLVLMIFLVLFKVLTLAGVA
jgi:hypothetical protein